MLKNCRTLLIKTNFQDWYMTEGKATQRFKPYQFVLEHEGLTHAEFSRKYEKGTITKFLFDNNLVEECISWLRVGTGTSPLYLCTEPH
jgi:hypothetical protein